MNINTVKNRLENLKSKWSYHNESILFSHKFEINTDLDSLLENTMNEENFTYMYFPMRKKILTGFGEAMKMTKTKYKKKYEIISNEENPTINIFGRMYFNMDKKEDYPWTGLPSSYFHISKILFSFCEKNNHAIYTILINRNFNIKKILDDIQTCMDTIKKKTKFNGKKVKLSDAKSIPNKEKYIQHLKYIKDKINNNKVKKVVLSRMEKHKISADISFNHIIRKMNSSYPECFNFLIKLSSNCYFLGSSPEKIISKKNEQFITTALAGTAVNSHELNNVKDRKEHEFVINHLKNRLGKVGRNITVQETNKLKLGYAHHIKTVVKGNTSNHILDILKKIYPTPALCGTPTSNAMEIINSLEPFNRGLYGGVLGSYDDKGNGSFYVPIRSALIRNNKIYFYSGGGVIKESEVENEWEETELKLKHLKFILE